MDEEETFRIDGIFSFTHITTEEQLKQVFEELLEEIKKYKSFQLGIILKTDEVTD